MKIRFNGEWMEISNSSLLHLMEQQGLGNKTGIAIAINEEVISRGNWSETELNENDQILVITAAAGG